MPVPAVERDEQELALQHNRGVAEDDRQDQRIPGRLMLHRDDRGAGRQVLEPADLAVEPDDRPQQRKHTPRPEPPEPHDPAAWSEEDGQAGNAEQRGDRKKGDVEGERAPPAHRAAPSTAAIVFMTGRSHAAIYLPYSPTISIGAPCQLHQRSGSR